MSPPHVDAAAAPRVIYGSFPVSNPTLRGQLDSFARAIGHDVVITSGDRIDPARNRAAGGRSNSRHLLGLAVDLQVRGLSNWETAIKAQDAFPTVIFEFNHVHVDLDPRNGVPYRGVREPTSGREWKVPNFRPEDF
jgi:hypothetical protein